MGHIFLENAPITEGLIDIRVAGITGSLDAIADVRDRLEGAFPKVVRMEQIEGHINFSPATAAEAKILPKQLIGFRYESADSKDILQLRRDGLTLSRLKPYGNWENLKATAEKAWKIFINATAPLPVQRIAVRYINKLDLPCDLQSLRDWLTAPPSLPPDSKMMMNGFFSRIMVNSGNASGIITQALEPTSMTGGVLPIILDIDVFSLVQLDYNSDEVWTNLDKLRLLKNDIFFKSLTDKALGEYK
jgi:uncharacterized protein (TIGR04255 family)